MALKRIPADRRLVRVTGGWKEQVEVTDPQTGTETWYDVDGVTYTSAFSNGDMVLLDVSETNGLKATVSLFYAAAALLFKPASGVSGGGGDPGNFIADVGDIEWVFAGCDTVDEDVEEGQTTVGGNAAVKISRYAVSSFSVEAHFLALALASSLSLADLPSDVVPDAAKGGEIVSSRVSVAREDSAGAYTATFTVESRIFVSSRTVQQYEGA